MVNRKSRHVSFTNRRGANKVGRPGNVKTFIDMYVETGDGPTAVLLAGYKCRDIPHAERKAKRLLSDPKVKTALEKREVTFNKTVKTLEDVKTELQRKKLELAKIREEIAGIDQEILKGHVATKHERQVFWTNVMMDPEERMPNRLRASELLGKSQMDFGEALPGNANMYIGKAVILNPIVRDLVTSITRKTPRLPTPGDTPLKEVEYTTKEQEKEIALDAVTSAKKAMDNATE